MYNTWNNACIKHKFYGILVPFWLIELQLRFIWVALRFPSAGITDSNQIIICNDTLCNRKKNLSKYLVLVGCICCLMHLHDIALWLVFCIQCPFDLDFTSLCTVIHFVSILNATCLMLLKQFFFSRFKVPRCNLANSFWHERKKTICTTLIFRKLVPRNYNKDMFPFLLLY